MTKMKRILVLMLSCLLLAALVFAGCEKPQDPTQAPDPKPTETNPPEVKLPEEVKSTDMVFKLQRDGTYMLVSYSGSAESVTIPASVEDYKVTAVADACFKGMTGLKKVEITHQCNKYCRPHLLRLYSFGRGGYSRNGCRYWPFHLCGYSLVCCEYI